MADSVVEIVNTTLTSTELPDSATEHTLITTDANTSYVIKDVQFNAYGNSLFPKINGTSIGEWSSSLTGTEVIDVNSTLKVTTNTLYEEDDFSVIEGRFFSTRLDAGTTDTFGSMLSTISQVGLFNQNNVITKNKESDVSQYTDQNLFEGEDYVAWNTIHNGIMYSLIKRTTGYFPLFKYNSNNGRTTIDAGSSMAWPDPANNKIWYENAGALKYIDLTNDTTTTVRASFPIVYENRQRLGLMGIGLSCFSKQQILFMDITLQQM